MGSTNGSGPGQILKLGASARLLIAALFLVVATMVITYYRNVESRDSARWVTHTYQVIEISHNFLSSVGASQAMLLQLILQHDSSDLAEYRSTHAQVNTLLYSLRFMTTDYSPQTSLIDQHLIPLVKNQQEIWDEAFTKYYQGSRPNLIYIQDKSLTRGLDSIRYYAHQFIENEEALLVTRNQQLKTSYLINDVLRFSFLFIIGCTCLAAFFTIRRQYFQNAILVRSLGEANITLESRVKERTEELTARNHELQESMEEIQLLHQSLDLRNQRLEESLGEVQLLYDQAPCGYHTIDATGLITKINKTELDWLGYTEDEVVGKKTVYDIITPSSIQNRLENIELLKEVGKLDNLEFDMVRKDRSTFPVLLNTIAQYDGNGVFLKNRSTVYDISQRKQLEKRLEEANVYLTHLNEEKNRFIGIATHDLKNPVNGILSLVHLLKRPNNLTADQLEYIQYIESSIAKMKALISKLLDLNRIEQMGTIVQKQPVDLDSFLDRTKKAFEEEAKRKLIEFQVVNQAQIREFETDPSLLGQIIDNLVSNAIKFSPFDKKVWLRLIQTTPDKLMVEVEDQGPGISADELPKLFGTFQRLSPQPTGGEISTGLGLSIVKAMVQALGAEVTVTSVVGRGTTFRVTFGVNN